MKLTSKNLFLIGLTCSFIAKVSLLFLPHELWWDSAVYLGIGKFIFSAGQAGLFEHIRPLLFPFILGIFWKLFPAPIITGLLFEILLSTLAAYLTFDLGKKFLGEKEGAIAGTLVAWSSILMVMSAQLYTEIPALV